MNELEGTSDWPYSFWFPKDICVYVYEVGCVRVVLCRLIRFLPT